MPAKEHLGRGRENPASANTWRKEIFILNQGREVARMPKATNKTAKVTPKAAPKKGR